MKSIWAPWRYAYLAGPARPAASPPCIFCAAVRSRDDRKSLVLVRWPRTFAMLNLYPYTNGHLLIAPLRHAASPSGVAPETRAEVMELLVRAEEAVRAEYRPGGLNVGMNLGRPAGAGVEGHFHVHLVPRWIGDTNFLTVAAETRVLSETLGATWRKLRRRLRDGGAAPGSGPRRRRRSA